jgi:hypothetical protein
MTLPVVFTANGPSGYNLTKSLRFRSSASAYLNRTPTSTGSRTTFTWSGWVKRGTLGVRQAIFSSGASNVNGVDIYFTSSDTLTFEEYDGTNYYNRTSAVYRDPSAWYHIVVAVDSTQATSSDRVKMYVNGSQITAFSTAGYPTQNFAYQINTASYPARISNGTLYASEYFDGYMAEMNFIDSQALAASSFGSFNSLTGVWQPAKYTGTYGTNGFYLPFTDTTSTTTIGYDFSGNSNNWTSNNISLTAGTTYDSMTDVPTLTSATTANYCVLNPLNCNSNITLSNGNLSATSSTNGANTVIATMPIPSTGKAYWEYKITAVASSLRINLGAASTTSSITPTVNPSNIPDAFALNWASGFSVTVNGSYTYGPTGSTNLSVNDVVMIAYDATTGNLWGGLNGTWYNSGNPAAGTGSITTMTAGLNWLPYAYLNTSGGANATDVNFGQQPFTYTPPTGFVALNTYNLPNSTIVKGNTVMDATLYTGNNSTQSVVNAAGFKPDLIWQKCRSTAYNHHLVNSINTATASLTSNNTDAGTDISNEFTSINSNGFSLAFGLDNFGMNKSGQTYVAWQWQAGQGTTSSNTSGSITSTVSVNASAGFSVVTYTGNGTSGATVGHGLGVAPKMIVVKGRTGSTNWPVWHIVTSGNNMFLNATDEASPTNYRFSGTPNSTTFGISSFADVNTNGGTYVAYCWTAVAGYSVFGSYVGNGSTDGPFVYTGFRPKYWMVKNTTAAGNSWVMVDTSRSPYNVANLLLLADTSGSEVTTNTFDILSNGIKLRSTDGSRNANGDNYIYMAFAENPFKNALAR